MKIIAIYKDEYNKEPKVFEAPDDTETLFLEEFEEFKALIISLKKKEKEDEN